MLDLLIGALVPLWISVAIHYRMFLGSIIWRKDISVILPCKETIIVSIKDMKRVRLNFRVINTSYMYIYGSLEVRSFEGVILGVVQLVHRPKVSFTNAFGVKSQRPIGKIKERTEFTKSLILETSGINDFPVTLNLDWNFKDWADRLRERIPKDNVLRLRITARAA